MWGRSGVDGPRAARGARKGAARYIPTGNAFDAWAAPFRPIPQHARALPIPNSLISFPFNLCHSARRAGTILASLPLAAAPCHPFSWPSASCQPSGGLAREVQVVMLSPSRFDRSHEKVMDLNPHPSPLFLPLALDTFPRPSYGWLNPPRPQARRGLT